MQATRALFTTIAMSPTTDNWTSVRMTYLLMSALLLLCAAYSFWPGVIFIAFMQQVAVWYRKCPSMWFFEQAGYKETEI